MTAYVTKYALTIGILEVEGVVCHGTSSTMFEWKTDGHANTAHGKDWHRTREQALARAEEMRQKKIASLKKKIEQLEKLKF
ncbi:hypothetical protein HW932_18340 [Allochromatium humboldtianum]|uniref:Uncharacterized protein n=1 Tax=Allochromatium humboldtianum TaxID=504901 RepID=A0A850RQN0_9GAMM|nr:hypothetical protein [Allochromatium humboldtianum]